MNITIRDFQPILNNWHVDKNETTIYYNCEPLFIVDGSTGRRYLNETKGCVATKCALVALATPFVHPFASIANIAYRLFKILSGSHVQTSEYGEKTSFKRGIKETAADLLRITLTPIGILGLQLSALYGIVRPYDGRKLYATIERGLYETFIIAPCFQPTPERHFFGGDIYRRDAY